MSGLARMTLAQLVKFAQVLRKRHAAHVQRSTHVRHIFRTGGFEIAHGKQVLQDRNPSPPVLTKHNRLGEQPDAGARRAGKKALELKRDLLRVQEELSKANGLCVTKVAELTSAIAAFDELSKAEKVFLGQSGDPRPLITERPALRLRFLGPPHDPLRPGYIAPRWGEMYGGKEKYLAALKAYQKERKDSYGRLAGNGEVENNAPVHPTLKFGNSTVVIDDEEFVLMIDTSGDQPPA